MEAQRTPPEPQQPAQEPMPQPGGTWPSWINLLAGIWVFFSPWIWGFSTSTTPLWNHIVLGVLIAVTAIVAIGGYRGASWWNVIFGIWLIISPFVLRYSMIARVTGHDVVLGIIVTIMALISALSNPRMRTST